MREIRLSGSVEGVVSNHDPYSDSPEPAVVTNHSLLGSRESALLCNHHRSTLVFFPTCFASRGSGVRIPSRPPTICLQFQSLTTRLGQPPSLSSSHRSKNVVLIISLVGSFVGSFNALANLVNHSELVMAFRLWTTVPHRSLHHGIWCDPTETRAEYVTQIVDREIRHASFLQGRSPCPFDTPNGLP
jgi:hypothetical protein